MYIMLVIAAVFVFFAERTAEVYKKRSVFIDIMAGLVTISAGVDWISQDPAIWTHLITGTAIVAFGLYYLIMIGVDLMRGD